jgi:hypothetical protein
LSTREEINTRDDVLPRKGYMLSFKWNNWSTFTAILLQMCKLLSKLINSTAYKYKQNQENDGKKGP